MPYVKKYKKGKKKRGYYGIRTRRYRRVVGGLQWKRNTYGSYVGMIHKFKRTTGIDNMVIQSTHVSTGASMSTAGDYLKLTSANTAGNNYYSLGLGFAFKDIVNHTEFQELFDAYRLMGVKIKLFPITGRGTMYNNGTTETVLLHTCIDYDDNSAFTSDANGLYAMREFDSYKFRREFTTGDKGSTWYVRPHASQLTYQTALTNGYTEMSRWKFIDTTNDQVPYYGTKIILEWQHTANSSVDFYIKFECTYYFQFKDVR